jgi:hypothetical protein
MQIKEFPTLQRLVHVYAWVAAAGGAMVVIGLGVGVFVQAWAVASALLGGGVVALVGGLGGHVRSRDMIERLRNRR